LIIGKTPIPFLFLARVGHWRLRVQSAQSAVNLATLNFWRWRA